MPSLAPYKRVLQVAKKPSLREFKILLKITGIGTMIIGGIGFIIFIISRFIGAL